MDSELKEILSDNLSGSNELLLKLNHYFLKNFDQLNFTEDFFQQIEKSFISFISIQEYLRKFKSELKKGNDYLALSFLKEYPSRFNNSTEVIYSKLKNYLKDNITIITISNSNTVFEVIKKIKVDRIKKIVVCESRPQFEGRIFAEKIADIGLKVNLITEADIPKYVQISDLALIGSDQLLSNGNVINKTGSKLLGIICKFYQKPFLVISDGSKLNSDSEFYEDEKPANEIFDKNKPYIIIKNHYFEEVDRSLITEIITDL